MTYQSKTTAGQIKKTLLRRQKEAASKLAQKHTQAWRYLTETQVPLPSLKTGAARLFATSALASSLAMSQPTASSALHELSYQKLKSSSQMSSIQTIRPNLSRDISPEAFSRLISARLMEVLPSQVRPLTQKEEKEIEEILRSILNIKASAELDGKRLNTNYGVIGAEQHLMRFPNDRVELHGEWIESGLAPKTSAWNYFASSQEALTPVLLDREKYYIAVQTFLSPQWRDDYYHLKDWFRYRKMIVVNPKTGQVVVVDIADAGPSTWTGKQFGGSPEVMEALGLHQGSRQGEVLVFFVDDLANQIPLGPFSNEPIKLKNP